MDIELLFDNSSAKIGGEYASFNEVSIKRVMTRDAQSDYFINNTKCRRKDVQDIFLGTGLGPSSYAIIEQGMVTKLVSAKPDELRTHIEEAAGVSKYRERRRETESRIKRTRENLSRVKDIRDEIGRLIKRLENQAKAAEKYNVLKKDKAKLELDKAVLFSIEAKSSRDDLQKKLESGKWKFETENAVYLTKPISYQIESSGIPYSIYFLLGHAKFSFLNYQSMASTDSSSGCCKASAHLVTQMLSVSYQNLIQNNYQIRHMTI